MITAQQAIDLAQRFQIDTATVFREYLQLSFLNALYQRKEGDAVCFKGGTAIRLLFGSPRFSEDSDFDTTYSKKELRLLIGDLGKTMSRELPGLKILPLYSGKNGIRFRIKLEVPFLKFPLVVRLDFTHVKIIKAEISGVKTEFPVMVYPLIYHQSPENILREKLIAMMERQKGRDVFDVWFLLSKSTKIKLSSQKMNIKMIIKRVKNWPDKELDTDLRPFLSINNRRIIPELKRLLISKLEAE